MMLVSPMMTATPNDVCLTAHWANIASLRNEVEQHHFERSEKHHIAAGDRPRLCDRREVSPPKNPESSAFRIFSFVSAGHNIICVAHATSFER